MDWNFGRTKLAVVLTGVFADGGFMALHMSEAGAAQQSNFMGGAPEILERGTMGDVAALKLRFPAGVRSNWHTHSDGQLLMVESGHGLHQVRGQAIEERGPGDPWWTPAGVEHWHGAHPNEAVVQWTFYAGTPTWMDPVTDDQYKAPPRR
jgi:quercetin dioxygenase-like cupin family protein